MLQEHLIKIHQLTFSLEIDATKVVTVFELSTEYKALIGTEYPNNLFSLEYISKDDIKVVLDGVSNTVKLIKSTEVKVTIINFYSVKM